MLLVNDILCLSLQSLQKVKHSNPSKWRASEPTTSHRCKTHQHLNTDPVMSLVQTVASVPLELSSVKYWACVWLCVCVCVCVSVRVADSVSHPSHGPKNEPHGFPKMEGKWQLRMLEAWPWWEWGCWSSNWAKSGDSGGINLLLNQGRMTQGYRAGKAPFFSLSTVFECDDSNLCAHHLYLQCSRLLGITFTVPEPMR